MIDTTQETEIISAFGRAGLQADAYDFKAEIDKSLTVEENLSQLEGKTGFKPRPKLPKIDSEAWGLEQAAARFLARGYEMEIKECQDKDGKEKNRLVFFKRNKASFASVESKPRPALKECRIKHHRAVLVRFIKDIPAHIGAENEKYGPYQAGQAVEMPQLEAEWMVRGKLADYAGGYEAPESQPQEAIIEANPPILETKEAQKIAPEPESAKEKGMIYAEGREITDYTKGNDGFFYSLVKDEELWAVIRLQPQKKKKIYGGVEVEMDYLDGCYFKKYREAWLYFLECLEGKKPDCETWKMPKEAKT